MAVKQLTLILLTLLVLTIQNSAVAEDIDKLALTKGDDPVQEMMHTMEVVWARLVDAYFMQFHMLLHVGFVFAKLFAINTVGFNVSHMIPSLKHSLDLAVFHAGPTLENLNKTLPIAEDMFKKVEKAYAYLEDGKIPFASV